MNGATAEPWARTINAPSIAIIKKSGASQYFLRTRMNFHNSLIKDIRMPKESLNEF